MLNSSDMQTLSDWLNITTGPYTVVGWRRGPSNDGKERLHPVRKLTDVSESEVMGTAREFSGVSARTPSGSELMLPRRPAPDDVTPPLSLSDTLEELQSLPRHLNAALPDTVLLNLDMCEGGRRLADVIEDTANFIRDLCEQIADRGFDRAKPEAE